MGNQFVKNVRVILIYCYRKLNIYIVVLTLIYWWVG